MQENFEALRNEMVDLQLITRGIKDKRVLQVMRDIPREEFVPSDLKYAAYDDCALPIGEGQTISQPYMVAIMTECLQLKGDEKVLEIGTGSGYQAAILSRLSKKVFTIERVPELAERSKEKLEKHGFSNVQVILGDGTEGYENEVPFDGIIVTASCPDIPKPLVDQLAEGGRLILPIGERFHQVLTTVTKSKGKIKKEESIGCVFVPLLGKYGWRGDQPLH